MANNTGISAPMYFPGGLSQNSLLSAARLSLYAYNQYNDWVSQCYPNMDRFSWKPSLSGFTFYELFYWTYSAPIESWRCKLLGDFTFQEPIGFLAREAATNTVYVVFRGTASSKDAEYDLNLLQVPYTLAGGYGLVHEGFNEIYGQLSPLVRAAIAKQSFTPNWVVTGHSLGAALASLAVPDIITNTSVKPGMGGQIVTQINFGSPRVGNSEFATKMNGNKVATYRIVNTEDIVPETPLAVTPGSIFYKHIGTPVDYTANYFSDDGNHSMMYSYLHAIKHQGNPQGPPIPTPVNMSARRLDLSAAHRDVEAAKAQTGGLAVPSDD